MTFDLTQFNLQFTKGSQIALNASSKAINSSILEVYKKTVDRTPVGNPLLWHPPYWPKDYIPGILKESWKIAFNSKQRDKAGRFSTAQNIENAGGLTFRVTGSDKVQTVSIYNPQPYAQRVEYEGWSSQAPAGMLRISIMEYPMLIVKNANKYRIK